MKTKLLILSLLFFFTLLACSESNNDLLDVIEEPEVIKKENLIIGATLNREELNTMKEELYLKDGFKYLTPANAAKQQIIHPNNSSYWDWSWVDEFIEFSKKHNLEVRLHGPISPQVSSWAREDSRSVEELEKNMTDFLVASCKKYSKEPLIKWMDIVNETILTNGEFNPDKPGTNVWESPWYKMGLDEKDYPIYILKAFEIATEHAPNIKLVYNQHGGMQTAMWDKVKETVLHIRSKGHRVDGIGWQGHLMLAPAVRGFVDNPDQEAKKLSDLIDWAHANDLEFHVTELDYLIKEKSTINLDFQKQAAAYKKIVDVLKAKRATGIVTLNLWDVAERFAAGKGYFQSIYDTDFKPTPAYKVIKEALNHQF